MILPDKVSASFANETLELEILKKEPLIIRPKHLVIATGSAVLESAFLFTAEEAAVADALVEIVKQLWRNDRIIAEANRIYLRDIAFGTEKRQYSDSNFDHDIISVRATLYASVYKGKAKK